jgi:serine protease Do
MHRRSWAVAVAALVLGLALGAAADRYAPTPWGQPLTSALIPRLAARALPSVVTVVTTIPGQLSQQGERAVVTPAGQGLGSGFVIDRRGLILTNDHVVSGASTVQVQVPGVKRRLFAQVVGTAYDYDLALLKVSAGRPLPVLRLSDAPQVAVGAWDVAIGNPEGLQHTVTVGVVSAHGRSFTIGNRHYKNLLQTDAPINPGNSGGPLIDLGGRVIGVNTAVTAQGYGLGFAIPAASVKRQLPRLLHQHLRPVGWLGAEIATARGATAAGVLVEVVLPGSPAQTAGLRAGDEILSFGNTPLRTAPQTVKLVERTPPRTAVRLRVRRAGRALTLTAVLAERPTDAR